MKVTSIDLVEALHAQFVMMVVQSYFVDVEDENRRDENICGRSW